MSLSLPFDEFWSFAQARLQQRNYLSYHRCCDSWSTRNSKYIKESHSSMIHWREIMATLDRSIEDKKQALQAMMVEEGWQIPVVVNKHCLLNPNPNQPGKRGPKLKHKPFVPEVAYSRPIGQNFMFPDQAFQNMMLATGMHPFN